MNWCQDFDWVNKTVVVFCCGYNKSQVRIKSKLWEKKKKNLEKIVACALLRKPKFIHFPVYLGKHL